MRDSLGKLYVNGEIDIHYHFWVSDSENYCILFQRPSVGRELTLLGQGNKTWVCAANSRTPPNTGNSNHIEMPMFVNVIEHMQSPEVLKKVVSVVRLHPLNQCLDPAVDPIEHGFRLVLELFTAQEDRESVAVPLGRCLPIGEDKLLNQVIKGRAEVIQNFTDSDRPFYGDVWGLTSKYPNLMTGLWLNLFGDEMTLGFDECIDFPVQRTQLLMRPVELGVDADECCHVYSSYGEEIKDSEDSQGLRVIE